MIVVDRIEGDRAVLEIDGEGVVIPASALPAGAGEGAVLILSLGDSAAVLAEGEARLKRLRAHGPQDDVIDLTGEIPNEIKR